MNSAVENSINNESNWIEIDIVMSSTSIGSPKFESRMSWRWLNRPYRFHSLSKFHQFGAEGKNFSESIRELIFCLTR